MTIIDINTKNNIVFGVILILSLALVSGTLLFSFFGCISGLWAVFGFGLCLALGCVWLWAVFLFFLCFLFSLFSLFSLFLFICICICIFVFLSNSL